ncbi:MAG: Hsp20/alpha crystallin family protein [Candidatus Paceibacterota bacterium]
MAIIRLDPFGRRHSLFRPLLWDEQDWPEVTMTEGLDVYEENGNVVVKAPVPGIPSEKVDVTFEDGVLKISGRVEEKKEEKEKKRVVYKSERIASFDYTTVLPRPINQDSIKASVENGVVMVTAKIAEAARPKKIAVQTSKK